MLADDHADRMDGVMPREPFALKTRERLDDQLFAEGDLVFDDDMNRRMQAEPLSTIRSGK